MRQLVTTTCYERVVQYTCTSVKTTKCAKEYVRNSQVFLPQEDDGFPLEDDDHVGVLSIEVVDELDQVAVTMRAKVLGAQICHLILVLDVVDAALLYQLLHEKVPQRDVLCSRTVGAVAGDEQRRRVINVQWHAAKALIEAQLKFHVGAEHRLVHCQSCRYELCLHRGLCGQPLQSHLKAGRGVGQHHDV